MKCLRRKEKRLMVSEEQGWMVGRDRPVRVYLTEEEHAAVRQAAALADKSVSRFSIEAIVEVARRTLANPPAAAAPAVSPTPAKKGKKKK
jgi:hypothetical protein